MIRLFVEHLCIVDFAYLDPERGLIGDSLLVDVEFQGEQDEDGILFDFGVAKKSIKEHIDESIDHKLVVPMKIPRLTYSKKRGHCELHFHYGADYSLSYQAPEEAVCLIEGTLATPETLAEHLAKTVRPRLPENVTSVHFSLTPEPSATPYYHYSHGLKRHFGNCQRIAHGHRSRIEIYENGIRSPQWESYWTKKWNAVHIGNREDLTSKERIDKNMTFSYTSNQGKFTLTLPRDHCYLIDKETTVENIAKHIALSLKEMEPLSLFQVKAFEGIQKGALASS